MTQETNRTAARLLGLQTLKDARLRLSMTLLLVMTALLAAPIEAVAYTVTLTPGDGSGSDIVLNSENPSDNVGEVEDWKNAPQGKFYTYKGHLEFKAPGCPDTFTSPSDLKKFGGWQWNNGFLSVGSVITITGDETLTAYWEYIDFNDGVLKYKITNTTPNEVEVKEVIDHVEPDFVIPSTATYKGAAYAVTGIGSESFSWNYDLSSVKIPANVRYIGEMAFTYCGSLTSVEIGSGISSIGDLAFEGCDNLTVTFHNFPKLGAGCFSESTKLRLAANKASDDAYWATFYSESNNFLFDDKTTVYWAELDGTTLKLHEVEDRIVNSYTAVILKSTQEYLVMSFTGDECKDGDVIEADNSLCGVSERTLRETFMGDGIFAVCVLGMKNNEVGFYEYTGEYIPAGKAFIKTSKITNDARGFTFAYDDTTDVVELKNSRIKELKSEGEWYSIDGRRLSSKPMAKGVYIVDGKKVVIK